MKINDFVRLSDKKHRDLPIQDNVFRVVKIKGKKHHIRICDANGSSFEVRKKYAHVLDKSDFNVGDHVWLTRAYRNYSENTVFVIIYPFIHGSKCFVDALNVRNVCVSLPVNLLEKI